MAAIARNQTPRTTDRIPPALAMTSRPDAIAGFADTIWNPDHPESLEGRGRKSATRAVSHARNSAIAASARQALIIAPTRDIPDRNAIYFHNWIAGASN